ncbi:MAG: hypothetical protein A3F13_03970 [Gammaproteobacteria bacterium RIFCSPHIGHO2_12_FULL_40_19]|nr:MAG: hypothetical protein A3F13_03970 [Gammaproteobacteria bacterium RIFCSPHIGHO2_12_FULL_40_19]
MKRRRIIKQRRRIFVAVEGAGEQAFIKFLQHHSDQKGLNIHLDCETLNGGGYKTMFERAVHYRSRKGRNKVKAILIVDADRAEKKDDGWSIEKLRAEVSKKNFAVCFQTPNQEGLLLRMLPGKERLQPNASETLKQLRKDWNGYQKPVDAHTLISKFSLNDMLRVADCDMELKNLLIAIGLVKS